MRPWRQSGRHAARVLAAKRVLEVALFGCLPLVLLCAFTLLASRETYAWDFHAFWGAARNVLHGRSPYASFGADSSGTAYPLYLYPPLLAEAIAPLGALPFIVAAGLFVAASVAAIVSALWLLRVRDWRCYGAAFLWLPVLHGLRLGTITPFLVLGLAACWRLRERSGMTPLLSSVVTAKLFLWPLLVSGLCTRRIASAARVLAWTLGCVLAGWAIIGFAGFTSYPSLLSATQDEWIANGYGAGAVLMHLGVPHAAAGAVLFSCAAALLALSARASDDRLRFGGAIVIACAFSPAAWLHYVALLLVVVAIFQPSLGWAWVVPLALWLSPGEQADGNALRLALWAAVLVSTLWVASGRGARVAAPWLPRNRPVSALPARAR
jgi:hypothetical protein